uniref:VWA domain-containing protein n=1 Tax=Panagrellus redivivus TaxID=6233 RepID=A0A7E4UTW7_PANRE
MRPPSLLLAAALAAWVLAVFGTASTDGRFNTYVNPHGKLNALEAASRAGMSSLTFVFDRTGSMFDDLDQVRRGTEGIFNTVMKQRERFIYNYVLVMFHDPGEPLNSVC